MTKYFILKNQNLIDQYIDLKLNMNALHLLYIEFSRQHGIRSLNYYNLTNRLKIDLIDTDLIRFNDQLNPNGEFKEDSKLNKAWIELCKQHGVNINHNIMNNLIALIPDSQHDKIKAHVTIIKSNFLIGCLETDIDVTLPKQDFTEISNQEYCKYLEDFNAKRS